MSVVMSEKRYERLNEGDRIEAGDEFINSEGKWVEAMWVGFEVLEGQTYRRLVGGPDPATFRELVVGEDLKVGDVFCGGTVYRPLAKVAEPGDEAVAERCGTCRFWRPPYMAGDTVCVNGETVITKNWTEPTCMREPTHIRAVPDHWCGEYVQEGKVESRVLRRE